MKKESRYFAILFNLVLLIAQTSAAFSQTYNSQKAEKGAVKRRAAGGLPETELLKQNDHLFPGQSRTQAAAMESETGHLTPEEDKVLIPMLRKQKGKK